MSKIDVDATVEELNSGSLPGWIADHLKLYRESGGHEGHMWDSTAVGGPGLLPCLLLTTTGRRSGRLNTLPLIYGTDSGRWVIVGSKGGADTHPGWYFNLLANPAATLQVGPEEIVVTAKLAEGAERDRLWARMAAIYPPYNDYQAKTARPISIFIFERAAG